MKTDQELKELAMGMHSGTVFSNMHLRKGDENMMSMIFMPLALGALSKMTEEEISDVGLIYEHLSAAGPRGINGYPTFFSFNILTKRESETLFEHLKKIQEFMEPPDPTSAGEVVKNLSEDE